jgi:hypothetical protein
MELKIIAKMSKKNEVYCGLRISNGYFTHEYSDDNMDDT